MGSSSSGWYKLVGVNPHSANVGVAMMLADFITNEDNQNKRFNDRKLGPSNINANASEAVQSAPAIAALAEQSSYATLQRVGANYWSSAASLGEILRPARHAGQDHAALVDDAVAGITHLWHSKFSFSRRARSRCGCAAFIAQYKKSAST